MNVIVTSLVILLLLSVKKSIVFGCGDRLGKGIVMCDFGEDKNIDSFDFQLCTHAHIGTTTFLCSGGVCWPDNSTAFEKTVRWLRPNLPGKIGFRVEFDQPFMDQLATRLRRILTAKRLITFMEERGFSFLIFLEATDKNFQNTVDRNSLKFIEEIASSIHNREWHIGLSLKVGTTELAAKHDLVKLSQIVDWFHISAIKHRPNEPYIQPFLPISSSFDPVGTTDYWIKHVLQWVKPECVLLYVHLIGLQYSAKETAVEPGPGSKAVENSQSFIYVTDVCENLEANNCLSHWDNDTGTPWAVCGDDIYTYIDPRSMKLRTDLARQYKLAGMSVRVDTDHSSSNFCGYEDPFEFLRAMQGIRNVTDQ